MYVIGIDGGGTKTCIAVFDINGTYYGIKNCDFPSRIDSVSFDEVHFMIQRVIVDFFAEKEIAKNGLFRISSIFLGLGGSYSQIIY